MKKKTVIIIIISIIVLLIIKEIIDFWPYFMVGPPFSIFSIYNQDSKNHSVNVKVYVDNKLIINETYELESLQSVQYPEKWDDYGDKDKLYPRGIYNVEVILDNNINKTQSVTIDTWQGASIGINNEWIDINNPIA